MKNIVVYYILFCSILLSACKREELSAYTVNEVFVGGEDIKDELSKKLVGSTTGWNFFINRSSVEQSQVLAGYYNFSSENGFEFAGNYNSSYAALHSGNEYFLSDVRNLVKLHFKEKKGNTQSKYGQLLVENTNILDSIFTYSGIKNDTLIFIGDDLGNVLKLKTADQLDKDNVIGGAYENYIKTKEFLKQAPRFFFNVDYKGRAFFFYKDDRTNEMVFHYQESGLAKFHKTAYGLDINKIGLQTPFYIDGQLIDGFSGYKMSDDVLTCQDGKIKNDVHPTFLVSGINDFLRANSADTEFRLWKAEKGWAKRGADDMYNIRSFYSIANIIFQYANGNNSVFHRIGLAYFPGWYWWNGDYRVTSLQKDNKLLFSYYGLHSSMATTPAAQAIQDGNLVQFTSPEGVYVIKTIDNQIVLVNAKDANTWIFFK